MKLKQVMAALLRSGAGGAVGCKPGEAVRQGAVIGKGSKPASILWTRRRWGRSKVRCVFAGSRRRRIKIDIRLIRGA